MEFNTAVFYDIENLLKGYSFTQETVANLSLSEIVASIRRVSAIGQISVQRAYANWSDPRLAIMRGEINELGIEPVQVFGFGREPTKNAADIQLAIDAIDLAHLRPALDVFVIVSGDGGFSALAKKLHEYGKTVVGCAYRTNASRILKAVCDEFVWVSDPEVDERESLRSSPATPARPRELTDPRNLLVPQRIAALKRPYTTDKILQKARELLQFYANSPTSKEDLAGSGIVLPVFREAFAYVAPDFNTARVGFPKMIEFLQWVTSGTQWCVVRRTDSQPVLADRRVGEWLGEILPELPTREIHTPEVYRLVLATDQPVLRLAGAGNVSEILGALSQAETSMRDLGWYIEDTVSRLQGRVSTEIVKHTVLALVASGVFLRQPEGVPIAEQKLILRPECRSVASLILSLRKVAVQKLTAVLGDAREEVLQHILPPVPD